MNTSDSNHIRIASESTLAFAVGYLAGAMDERMGTGIQWIMKVYMDMQAGKLSLAYITKLEREIGLRWPVGETPPTIKDVL